MPEPIAAEDDELAGASLARVLAFSDGVFAIAATLLVLNLRLPGGLHGHALHRAIDRVGNNAISAVITFLVIGLYWLGHRRTWRQIRSVDGLLLTLNTLFLGAVIFMPFGAQLLGEYGDEPISVILYASLMTLASILLGLVSVQARHAGHKSPTMRQVTRADWSRSAATASVFVLSMPIAVASPSWAKWVWLLIPATTRVAVRGDARARLRAKG